MNHPAVDTERPLRADARRNRERVLEAARAAFGQSGADTQMDDVAQRAGVGVGTVYRHFPTKDSLMVELVRQKFTLLGESARDALAEPGEPFEVFAALLRRNCEAMARDAAIQHALMGAGEHIWIEASAEQHTLMGYVAELMGRAQRAGTMRRDVGPTDIPMLMCGVSATMAHTGPGFDWHRHLELVLDAVRS